MTNIKNNLSPVEEQQFIPEEQLTLQRMLSQFEQPVPDGFIQIKAEHIGSTKPNWEDKPLSERYFFTHKEKEIQIDIPHTILEKLELEKGEDIKQSLYLDPKVLTRKKTYKGITIKEGEIFLKQPFTIQNLEKDIKKLLQQVEKLEEEKEDNQKMLNNFKQLVPDEFEELGQPKKYWGSTEGLDKPLCERYSFKYDDDKSAMLDITKELNDKLKLGPKDNFCVKKEVLSRSPEEGGITINDEEEIFLKKSFAVENLKEDINKLFGKIGELKKWINQFPNQTPEQVQEKIDNLQQELEIEKGWWDKWIDDDAVLNNPGSGKESIKEWETGKIWRSLHNFTPKISFSQPWASNPLYRLDFYFRPDINNSDPFAINEKICIEDENFRTEEHKEQNRARIKMSRLAIKAFYLYYKNR